MCAGPRQHVGDAHILESGLRAIDTWKIGMSQEFDGFLESFGQGFGIVDLQSGERGHHVFDQFHRGRTIGDCGATLSGGAAARGTATA